MKIVNKKSLDFKFRTGFSLVELMISIGIIGVIMSVVIINYSSFTEKLALSAAGQEMALAIRQAQIYGTSVKDSSPGIFNYSYGVYFFLNQPFDPSIYYIFVDKNFNRKYDEGDGCGGIDTECVEKVEMRNGTKVNGFCNSSSCPSGVNPSFRGLSITFDRPKTNAIIKTVTSLGVLNPNTASTSLTASRIQIIPANFVSNSVWLTLDKSGNVLVQ